MEPDQVPVSESENEQEVFLDPNSITEVIEVNNEDELEIENEMEEDFPEELGEEDVKDAPQRPDQDDSISRFLEHTDSIYTVDLNSYQQHIAVTGGGDDKAYLWNVASGEKIFELSGHKDSVSGAKFNHDGKLVATGSYDATVKIWDVQTGNLLQTLDGPTDSIESVTWHPKGNIVLAGSRDNTIWMWMSQGTFMNVFNGHSGPITNSMFSLDGKKVITSSEDSTIRVWDPKSASTITLLQGHGFHDVPILTLETHPTDNNIIISGDLSGNVIMSNISTGKAIASFRAHESSVESAAFSTSMPFAATCSLDKRVNIYDLNTLQLRGTCLHDDGVIKLKWHPTQPYLFTCSMDRTVRLWDSRTGDSVKVWKGHSNGILDFVIASDGSFIVTASDDCASLVFKI